MRRGKKRWAGANLPKGLEGLCEEPQTYHRGHLVRYINV